MPTPERGPCSCRECPVWSRSLFADLRDGELDALEREKSKLGFAKGERLFEQGAPADALHCIQSGIAKVVQKNARGKAFMVRIAPPGDSVGHRSLFTRETFRGTAEALEPLVACRVPKSAALRLLGENPGFARRLVTKMAQDIEASERDQQALREKNVRERLAGVLVKLHAACGERQRDRSSKLTIPITKADLAAMLGTAYETAVRAMTEFEREGLLRQEGRTVYVLDLERLVEATGDAPRH